VTSSTTAPRAPVAPSTPTHPRIRARRIEIKRDEGRRRRQRLLILAAVLVGLAGVAGLTRSPVLDIDRLVVDGASRTGRARVLDTARLRRGGPMLDVDPSAVSRRLAGLAWVERASVQRRWPGTVRIRVIERRPVAQVRADLGWALVDASGRVLERRSSTTDALIEVQGIRVGPPGSRLPGAVSPMLDMVGDLGAQPEPRVQSVRSVAGELVLILAGGARVQVGPPDHVAAKLYALRAMVAAEKPHCLSTVDIRVPRAPVLTRKRGCA